jgi:hypothetical protein
MTQAAMPGTRSARPAYPPPLPVGFIDPGGVTPVERALRTQMAVAQQYSDWRGAHSPDIPPEVLRDNKSAFQVSDAALALPEAMRGVLDDSDAASKRVADLINGQRVGDDVASQIAAQRYWARAQRTLDSIKDSAKAATAARDLVANADDKAVPVIAEELSDYLASRGIPTGWMAEALSQKIPGLSDAQTAATLAARQAAVLAVNHENLTRAMAKDTAAPPLLDPYRVSAEPYEGGTSSISGGDAATGGDGGGE